ncbi:hypothetical protein [Papillibacter cinnamivorans]|uniref:DUF6199 domain-containing protein n=1 Tax=Papillibacter cinnamivorans DSM 12816 TaxID=1122930 RepID=A0A1W2B7U3_9FIRM|nr:hypothetical protein [Papillibacter cinnamivorans]SMC68762.1 hypothetical protein SAMN02745168_2059 [Papillibacter cinnamivorans DSM 12816]
MGNWQIGTATQIGLLLIVIGLICLLRPYQMAKWHENDPTVLHREHKRIQSRKKKSQRAAFDSAVLETEREPSRPAIILVRVLGILAAAGGAGLFIWSIL